MYRSCSHLVFKIKFLKIDYLLFCACFPTVPRPSSCCSVFFPFFSFFFFFSFGFISFFSPLPCSCFLPPCYLIGVLPYKLFALYSTSEMGEFRTPGAPPRSESVTEMPELHCSSSMAEGWRSRRRDCLVQARSNRA